MAMKPYKNLNSLIKILQIGAVVVLSIMMMSAMKLLFVLMKGDGLF